MFKSWVTMRREILIIAIYRNNSIYFLPLVDVLVGNVIVSQRSIYAYLRLRSIEPFKIVEDEVLAE